MFSLDGRLCAIVELHYYLALRVMERYKDILLLDNCIHNTFLDHIQHLELICMLLFEFRDLFAKSPKIRYRLTLKDSTYRMPIVIRKFSSLLKLASRCSSCPISSLLQMLRRAFLRLCHF